MPQSEFARLNTNAEDGALITSGLGNSTFQPVPPVILSDKIREKVVYDIGEARPGRKITIDLEKQGTLIQELVLVGTLPAGEATGDGTFWRYVQGVGAAIVAEVVVTYTVNHIATYHPLNAYSRSRLLDDEHKNCYDLTHSFDLTPAQRNTLAANPQEFRFVIPTPFECPDGHALPITALSNKPRITIKLQPAPYIIQTDNAAKEAELTLTNVKVEAQYVHLVQSDRAALTSLTMRKDGISYLFKDQHVIEKDIAAGAIGPTGHVISLDEFNGPVSFIVGFLQDQDDLDATEDEPRPMEFDLSLLTDLSYEAESGNLGLYEKTKWRLEQPFLLKKFFKCRGELPFFFLNFAEAPLQKNVSTGHINFSNTNNPKLRLYKDVANTDALKLTLIGFVHNWTNIQAGNWNKIWV